jgi:hypothetical protein
MCCSTESSAPRDPQRSTNTQPPTNPNTTSNQTKTKTTKLKDLEDVYGGIFFGGAADLAPY